MRLHAGASSAAVQDSRGGRGGRGRAPKLALAIGFALLSSLALGVSLAAASAPTVAIDPTLSAGYATIGITGTVDPGDHEVSVYGEYSAEPASEGWQYVYFQSIPADSGPTPVSGQLSGLHPGTEYFVRLGAENGVESEVFSPEPNPSVTTKPAAPPTVTIEPVGNITGSSAHFSGHINPGATDPAFDTVWHFQCSPECPGLEGVVPADESTHLVQADATDLDPNTAYVVTLVGNSAGGEASAETTFSTAPTAPSDVQTLAVRGPVADTSARLIGLVNPHNSPASYWFEYGLADCASNQCSSAPPSQDGVVPVSGAAQVVGQTITGLQPETTYHYRLVVEADLGGELVGADQSFTTSGPAPSAPNPCPNEAIRTEQSAAHLPDCRAYELVSVADKSLNPFLGAAPLAPDGDHALYNIEGPVPGSPSGAHPTFIATRTSSGWRSRNILPSRAQLPGVNYLISALTPDLSKVVVSAFEGSGKGAAAPDVTLATLDGSGGQATLHTFPSFFGGSGIEVVASEDLSHVFVSVHFDADPSLPAYLPGIENIYDFGSGTPELADVMPDTGTAPQCGSSGNQAEEFATGGSSRQSEHWTSTDGSRLFFATRGDVCSDPLQLYMRDLDTSTTTLISGPPLVGDPDQGVDRFLQATPSGSQVFFRSATSYDAADDLDGDSTDMDIYRWTTATGQILCVTCSVSEADVMVNDGHNLHAAIAEDGSHVYFDSAGKFAGRPLLRAKNRQTPISGARRAARSNTSLARVGSPRCQPSTVISPPTAKCSFSPQVSLASTS